MLDFSCVTKMDRQKSKLWAESNRKLLNRSTSGEDASATAY
jgi:hypothetical protein